MICPAIEDFAALLPAEGALVGLDPGTRTIGIALSDRRRRIATPTRVIRRRKPGVDMAALLVLLDELGACGVILGLPLNMDGSEGPRAQSSRAFARNLAARTALPVALWDERLSTVAAERALLEADASRKRRSEVIDAVAAAYILQGALDRLARLDPGHDEA